MREGEKVRHFSITFGVQNHQLNHLPPADLEKLCFLALSDFCLNHTEKTSPITLTVCLIKPFGNYTHTHIPTHLLGLLV